MGWPRHCEVKLIAIVYLPPFHINRTTDDLLLYNTTLRLRTDGVVLLDVVAHWTP